MSKSLHLIAAAAALAALGGAPPAHAAPLSEWLGASAKHFAVTLAVPNNGGSAYESGSLPLQALLPGHKLEMAETRTNLLGTPEVLNQVGWDLSTTLQMGQGPVGFDRVTFDIDMAMSNLLQQPAESGQPLPLGNLLLKGDSRVEAQFRLDAATDVRMFGGSGFQEVAQSLSAAGIAIWDDALAEWQSLADQVPFTELGESFEWEARLGPGLYLWTPVLAIDHVVAEGSSLAFDSSFSVTLELSELPAPPAPPNDVPEPGSLALAAAGLAVLRWRGVQWRTGRHRSNTQW
jgi:hypothetical protein